MNKDKIKQLIDSRLALVVGQFAEVPMPPNVYEQTWRYYSDEASVDIFTNENQQEMTTEFESLSIPDNGYKGIDVGWYFVVTSNKKPGDNNLLLSIYNALSAKD